MDAFQNKMDMSLDEIILQEQKKKGILRTNNSDVEEMQEELLTVTPSVSMSSTSFLPEHSKFVPRRVPGLSQHQWIQFRNMTRFHHKKTGHIQKRFPGIPLIKLKRGFRQGILGNSNYKVWKQANLPRFHAEKKNSRKTYPLTSNYLQQFNKQNHSRVTQRGPGSTGSRGSLCSNCSRTSSVRSYTSYRSMPSNRSARSFRTRSSNTHKTIMEQTTYRFNYFLNRRIQQHIQHMQENKTLRLHNSSRENLIDEPAKCKPQPRRTWCTLHHRFKKYILNPIY